MTAPTRPSFFLSVLLFAMALSPQALSAQKTHKLSKNLVKRAEKVVEEIQKTEKQIEKTVKQYHKLLKKDKVKEREKEYKKLNDELNKTENRVAELRKRNDEMRKEANKFFTEWSQGLTQLNDPQLQTAARENLDRTQSRFAEITAAAEKAGDHYSDFLVELKNQISYLGLDLSDDAMSKLKTSRQKTNAEAETLFKAIDDLTDATHNYIKSLK